MEYFKRKDIRKKCLIRKKQKLNFVKSLQLGVQNQVFAFQLLYHIPLNLKRLSCANYEKIESSYHNK